MKSKTISMTNTYHNLLQTTLKRVHPTLGVTHRLEFKNVFGAVGGYVDGRIFVSCGKFGIALKLPPAALEILFNEKDVRKLRYFPKGHVKREYAVIPDRILKNRHALKGLVNKSIGFAVDASQSY